MRRSARWSLAGAAAACALLAAACGDDSTSSATTAAGTTAAATTAAATTAAATTAAATTAAGTTAAATTAAGGAGTTAAKGDLLKYDESAKCGTKEYAGNLAKIEATSATEVVFTLCNPDVAFPSKVAFSAMAVSPASYIDKTGGTGDLIDKPIGTGPYELKAWERGNQIVLEKNPNYWGTPAKEDTAVIRWSKEPAQRLVELQAGTADAIDNVGPQDFDKIAGDSSLKLVPRDPLNVLYLGFNRDQKPFDNDKVREAIALGIDRKRIVDNFYPKASEAATQFLPPAIFGYTKGFTDVTYDKEKAKALLAEAGYPNGFETKLSYRDVSRGYLPQPTAVATDIQAQLAEIGIKVDLDVQESTTFLDNAQAGKLGMHLLGWGADYPDATNFLDYHFGKGASPQFGKGFTDVQDLLAKAASTSDQAERQKLYDQVNALIAKYVPMVPIAHGGSAVAFKSTVEGAHASPLSSENLAVMDVPGQQQLSWLQSGEPGGLYCADETDGEALRVCEQINESLLAYKTGSTEVVPGLAKAYKANADGTVWTFDLRDGVKFSDGETLTANDVARSFRVQWDKADPAHKGRTGDFNYFSAFFGGFLNDKPS